MSASEEEAASLGSSPLPPRPFAGCSDRSEAGRGGRGCVTLARLEKAQGWPQQACGARLGETGGQKEPWVLSEGTAGRPPPSAEAPEPWP